jgi:predicted nucleic acid-binding protein
MKTVIADTGILIAYLNRREKFHNWAKEAACQDFTASYNL